MSVIEARELTKTFGRVTALDKLNLSVNEGEIHGFIGPNGAGKSTTIRVLLGMLRADSGQATILGKDVWQDAVAIHEQVAYVPSEANLWPNLTGGQVIDVLLAMRRQAINNRRRDDLIDYFEVDPGKRCRAYSKGNLQKVLIIAAFAADASIYILDEPTSGLDPLMERKFQTLLLDLREKGKTILLSSHMLAEVEKLCDRVSIIRQGSIVETGSLKDLRHLTRDDQEAQSKNRLEDLFFRYYEESGTAHE